MSNEEANENIMEKIADDLIVGARAIGAEIGASPRQVYRLAETGRIPVFKFGGLIASRRSQLNAKLRASDAPEAEA